MRENVLRDLASRAATDLTFLRQARQDFQDTLTRHGYHLTDEERSLVEGLRRQTASMTDEELPVPWLRALKGVGAALQHDLPPELAWFGPRKTGTARRSTVAGQHLDLRPSGYEPDELPDCPTRVDF